jgi:hypothetical protein
MRKKTQGTNEKDDKKNQWTRRHEEPMKKEDPKKEPMRKRRTKKGTNEKKKTQKRNQ